MIDDFAKIKRLKEDYGLAKGMWRFFSDPVDAYDSVLGMVTFIAYILTWLESCALYCVRC